MRRLPLLLALAACGDDPAMPDAQPACPAPPGPIATGDPDGHPAPLGSSPGQARAGRIAADQLPVDPAGLLTWAAGDFVLANARVALVIEDAGDSELHDPWGGRPVGIARVVDGALVEPTDFGELFVLTGASTVVTRQVTVIADGADGGAATVRATGRLAPLPFLANLLGALYPDRLDDIEAAIDYTLMPGAEAVEVTVRYASPRGGDLELGGALHGFAYVRRTPPMVPGVGFTEVIEGRWVQFVDDDGASWAYRPAGGELGATIAGGGFVGSMAGDRTIPACAESEVAHATLLIGGPGLDGIEQARGRLEGRTLRPIRGITAPGARVHATGAAGYLTRSTADAGGAFTVHVAANAAATLTAYLRGHPIRAAEVEPGALAADVPLGPVGSIHVTATDPGGAPLPVRVQVLPVDVPVPVVPASYGEPAVVEGRLHVEFPTDGDVTLAAPPGTWRVVVSRGFEYEIADTEVTVVAGETVEVDAVLDRVVATPGALCADLHVHTHRSIDSGDDARDKVRSAAGDGVELPVRSEHDAVASFQPLVDELGLGAWVRGIGSLEITSTALWGHFGAVPVEPDPSRPNGGAVPWARWPTPASPDLEVEALGPVEVLDAVRALPDAPAIIVNHPRQAAQDYFNYVGFDPETGEVARPEAWDDRLALIEVFNDTQSAADQAEAVADWYALLGAGRRVFAVGSSDSHHVQATPLGYPRTCVAVGTDDPAALDGDGLRDGLISGALVVSGGVFVDVAVGAAGPGETARGVGPTATVSITVQAPSWVDVDGFEVIVDGAVVDAVAIGPGDFVPPAIRWQGTLEVPVAAGGSWVIVWARGDAPLEPVHPQRLPFGLNNPVFIQR